MKIATKLVLTLMLGVAALHAQAQTYPAKPVRFIVPFPPGGPTDIMGRLAAQRLTEAWSVQVVADNRAGAGGNIGSGNFAKAPPDRFTNFIMTVAQSMLPSVYSELRFASLKNFAPGQHVGT